MGLRSKCVFFFCAAPLLCVTAAPPHVGPAELEQLFKKRPKGPIAHQVEWASRKLLGTPYVDFPLGEGPGARYDAGPRYRLDAFDCTTFVETVLALARTPSATAFLGELDAIRYHSASPDYLTRNHFPCTDWIPHNTKRGVITDITAQVAGSRWLTGVASGTINKRGWVRSLPPSVIRVPGLSPQQQSARLEEIRTKAEKFSPQTPSIPYIDIASFTQRKEVAEAEKVRRKQEEAELATTLRTKTHERSPQSDEPLTATGELEKQIHKQTIDLRLKYLIEDVQVDADLLATIPHGTLLNVVRPNWSIPGTKLNISHQGFVIQKKEGTFLRHVSRSGGRTKDVSLANYLRLCLLIPAIKGINLQQINEVAVKAAP